MANCPNCGSESIQLINETTQNTKVSWGRAAAGYLLFGVAGGVVGAVTGEGTATHEKAIVCLNCGTSWNPSDLYKIRQTIKQLTEFELDLSREADRRFLNDFVNQLSPYLESLAKKEKEAEDKLELAKSRAKDGVLGGPIGCLFSMILLAVSMSASGMLFLVSLLFIAGGIGYLINKLDQENIRRKISEIQFQTDKIKLQIKDDLKRAIQDFINSHPLD